MLHLPTNGLSINALGRGPVHNLTDNEVLRVHHRCTTEANSLRTQIGQKGESPRITMLLVREQSAPFHVNT